VFLGIEQADFTGKRLKELAMPYSSIVQSSMCRARETANVISGHLPNVPLHTCDLLQEGAPFPPEPPVGHWKPEMHVNFIIYFVKCLFHNSNWFTQY
jgi:serine/threonine-protein phosphatase PGAM5